MNRIAFLGAAILSTLFFGTMRPAQADGPHWQIPNPWTEYDMENGGRPKPPKVPSYNKDAKVLIGNLPLTYLPWVNPGEGGLAQMDDKCIKYYEEHCSIRCVKSEKTAFYRLIMLRAATAMREVDTYCPCPDSFPLWHSEEGREFMVWAAKQTWIASTTLNPKDAGACAKVILDAFIDTIRYREDKDLPGQIKAFLDYMKQIEEISAKCEGKDNLAQTDPILVEWAKISKNCTNAVKINLITTLRTFQLMTGDIPVCIPDAKVYMVDALVNMGPSMIPHIQEEIKNSKNPVVQAVLKQVSEAIERKANAPRK